MRKFNLLTLITICLFNLSCSSDDNNEQSEAPSIFGQWNINSKLIGENLIQLNDCEQGEGVIFQENLIANFIIVDEIGSGSDVIQEGYENCDFRYANYSFIIGNDNETIYRIVEGEGNIEGVDDSITTFRIEVLTNQNLSLRMIAQSNTGSIEDIDTNSVSINESEQQTLNYTRD
jgi:hypothetical protein